MAKFNINDKVVSKTNIYGLKGTIKDSFHNGYLVLWSNNDAEVICGKDLKLYEKGNTETTKSKLNLCKILKGHKGETFYSPTFGNVRLDFIDKDYIAVVSDEDTTSYKIFANGTYTKNGEICFFPTKDQKDWIKWDKENNHKTPKTWSELVVCNESIKQCISDLNYYATESIIKSALALLKIHQLIEACYDGNITNEEWENDDLKRIIDYYADDKNFYINFSSHKKSLIAFHTKEQAEEFLSYPENVQLLKDYFMI